MARLERLWVKESGKHYPAEIRVDWDNDRHQAIRVNSGEPEELASALEDLVRILNKEILSRKI